MRMYKGVGYKYCLTSNVLGQNVCLTTTPDGKFLVTGGDKGIIKFFNLKQNEETDTFKVHEGQLFYSSYQTS